MATQTRLRKFKQQSWLTYGLLSVLLISILLVGVRLVLPVIAHKMAISWLEHHGMQASIDNIELDLLAGKARVFGVDAKNDQGRGFSLSELSLSWHWRPLAQRNLVIDNASLNEFSADFSRTADGTIRIAGMPFPDTSDTTARTDSDPEPFTLKLKTLHLGALQTCYQGYDSSNTLTQDYCFNLGELDWRGNISYFFAAMSATDDLPLQIAGQLRMDSASVTDNILKSPVIKLGALQLGELKLESVTDILLNKLDLSAFHAQLRTDTTTQKLNFESLNIDSIKLLDLEQLELGAFSLKSVNVALRANNNHTMPLDYKASSSDIFWQGTLAYSLAQQTDTSQTAINGEGKLELNDTVVTNNNLKRQFLSLTRFDLGELRLDTLDLIGFSKLRLSGLDLLQREKPVAADSTHITSINTLTIDAATLSHLDQLKLQQLTIDGLAAYLVRNKNGAFEYRNWIPEQAHASSQTSTTKQSADFQYSIENFDLTSTGPLVYVDNSLNTTFVARLHDTHLQLQQLDSRRPDQNSHLKLSTVYDKSTDISLEVDATPLAERPDLNGSASITSLDLRTFSTLARQAIGHSIRSGQLDASIKLRANKGMLDSEADLTLNHFELRALSKAEAEQLDKSLGLPLDSSLSLLRDDNNQIRLKIPVTGDISSPSFNPRDAIRQATTKAITAAALYYYTPYGAVLVADKLYSMATALRFEPLRFSAGNYALDSEQKQRLDKIASMLVRHPAVNLSLCATATRTDFNTIYPKTDTSTVKPLSPAQNQRLLALAELRAQAVKDYLVGDRNIKPSRLAVCEPEYHPATETAVVELSI